MVTRCYLDSTRTGWLGVRIMWLSGISGRGAGSLVSQLDSTIKSQWVRTVTSQHSSWYYVRYFQDTNQPPTTNNQYSERRCCFIVPKWSTRWHTWSVLQRRPACLPTGPTCSAPYLYTVKPLADHLYTSTTPLYRSLYLSPKRSPMQYQTDHLPKWSV